MEVNRTLCESIQEENLERVERCLKRHADPLERIDYDTYFVPWNWLYFCHHLAITALLVEKNKDAIDYRIPELCGATLLFGAILFKDEAKIRYLVASGADINTMNDNGYSPLYYTIEQSEECRNLIPLLLELGANINVGSDKIKKFSTEDGKRGMESFYSHIVEYLNRLEEEVDFSSLKVHYDRLKKFEGENNTLSQKLSDKMRYLEELYEIDKLDIDDDCLIQNKENGFIQEEFGILMHEDQEHNVDISPKRHEVFLSQNEENELNPEKYELADYINEGPLMNYNSTNKDQESKTIIGGANESHQYGQSTNYWEDESSIPNTPIKDVNDKTLNVEIKEERNKLCSLWIPDVPKSFADEICRFVEQNGYQAEKKAERILKDMSGLLVPVFETTVPEIKERIIREIQSQTIHEKYRTSARSQNESIIKGCVLLQRINNLLHSIHQSHFVTPQLLPINQSLPSRITQRISVQKITEFFGGVKNSGVGNKKNGIMDSINGLCIEIQSRIDGLNKIINEENNRNDEEIRKYYKFERVLQEVAVK